MSLPSERSEPYKPKKLWWARVKITAESQLNRLPILGTSVIRMWRTGRLLLFRCKWKLTTLTSVYGSRFDVDKVYWVSPQRITYCSLREFNIHDFKGRVIDGDWDHLEKKFEDLDIYIALKQVCIEGKNWTDTIFYKRILERLNSGEILWRCRNENDLGRRCKYLESLFYTIRHEGYKSQHEILLPQKSHNPLKADDEVTISIGRHGDLLFCNGAHRLAIAKLLGIRKIPIVIAVRHLEWMGDQETHVNKTGSSD